MASSEAQRRKVIYPHDGQRSSGVLSLSRGDILEVEQAEGDWWKGSLLSRLGEKRPHTPQQGLFYSKFTVSVELEKPSTSRTDPAGKVPLRCNPPGDPVIYEQNDYISQSPPSDEMNCIICHSLASRPHQTTCCGQTVCLACAETWKKTNNSCPQCRKAPLNLSIDVRMERSISNSNVHCRNHTKGCDWTGRLGDVASHVKNNCQYVMVKCELQGCSVELLKLDLLKHMSSKCRQRVVKCPCCKCDNFAVCTNLPRMRPKRNIFLTYSHLITEHYKECPDWPMRCPNKCPQDNLTRASLQAHLDEDCPEQVISCQFSEAGCRVRVKRREMEEHLQKAMGQHMADMMRGYIKMKEELAVLMKKPGTLINIAQSESSSDSSEYCESDY